MGAALSIFVILSLSVFVIRIAAVALRFTGLPDTSARFQALSAFTGTGFTTNEAETVVNYPVRRRIISILMVVGNMGLLTILATLVVSLVQTDGEVSAVVVQLAWLISGMGLLWFLMLNKTADRILCNWIGKLLELTTLLGKRQFQRLLQVGDGYSVCEHPVPPALVGKPVSLMTSRASAANLVLLVVRSANGEPLDRGKQVCLLAADHTLVMFGPDCAHENISEYLIGSSG